MNYILGVDDAGRGPIIGPMVLSGVLVKTTDSDKLKEIGVKDSKLIAPNKREILAKQIKEMVDNYKSIKISPEEIDSREENGLNLNDLEAIKIAEIINKLTEGLKNVQVIVDCPSVNTVAWKNYLLQYIKEPEGKKFVIEHKADFKYPACAAASILAKVCRDAEIEKIKKELKVDFGSGYPADPKTKKFLEQRGHKYLKYKIIRTTWATWGNILKKSSQKKLF